MLCVACQTIFRSKFHDPNEKTRKEPRYFGRTHHQTVIDLERAALERCPICMVIWDNVIDEYWDFYQCPQDMIEQKSQTLVKDWTSQWSRTGIQASRSFTYYRLSGDSTINLAFRTRDLGLDGDYSMLGRYLQYRNGRAEWSRLEIESRFTLDPLTDPRFRSKFTQCSDPTQLDKMTSESSGLDWPLYLAKAWLNRCIHDHPKCRLPEENQWAPTRLLELTATADGMIRLIHTREMMGIKPYITLSHCWGKLKIPTLSRDTLPAMVLGIEVAKYSPRYLKTPFLKSFTDL